MFSFRYSTHIDLVKSDDGVIHLDKDTFRAVIERLNTSTLSYCEFYNLFKATRLDTFFLLDAYYDQGSRDRHWYYIWTMIEITGLKPEWDIQFQGPVYQHDSFFHKDLYKWGTKLGCIDKNQIDEDSFQNYMLENDLFYDSSFVANVIPKKVKIRDSDTLIWPGR